jgi:anti-sigma B factor antagonist
MVAMTLLRTVPSDSDTLRIYADETVEGHILFRVVGVLDAFTVARYRSAVAELPSPADLLIDLSSVPFIDSAGLGALIGTIRRIRHCGGEVSVACGRATLVRLLSTTGFDRIVPVASSVEEAARAFDEPGNAHGFAAGM